MKFRIQNEGFQLESDLDLETILQTIDLCSSYSKISLLPSFQVPFQKLGEENWSVKFSFQNK